ncbi:DNA polymerase beta subunit [Candidatus Magnetobacterium bavaricum]|uniref:DNA polymerase beta subunit n=1 Tax=Candidatus Magnetobacterium bavaricum TaxID=29290 RepID=A0A0F3GZC8_9BACT|nr:DNA polymerase beta subunit [Candidatus Magnetobacterium bavaricum]
MMDDILRKIVDVIAIGFQPERIILFGSVARGENSLESDYDICVIKKGVKHKRKFAQEIYKSLYGTKASVDVIVETPERFNELKDNPYLIYKSISEEGKLIYEK